MEAILLKSSASGEEIEIKPTLEDQKILALPRGKFYIEKYDKWIEFDDKLFNQVIKNFESKDLAKPFLDKGHKLEESYGDITGFQIEKEGLTSKLKLNQDGIEVVKSRKYRYISPALYNIVDTKKQKHNNVLFAITLTNIPALLGELPQIQSQTNLQLSNILENKPEAKNMERIALQAGLNKEASEEAILTVWSEKETKIVELSTKLKSEIKLHNDAAQKVAELSSELSELKTKELESEWETFKVKKIELGQMHASQADFWKDQYLNDKERCIAALESVPAKQIGIKTTSLKTEDQVSVELASSMKKIGLNPSDPEDVKIYKHEMEV